MDSKRDLFHSPPKVPPRQNEIITIDRLKLMMDEKQPRSDANRGIVRNNRRLERKRDYCKNQFILLLLWLLEPILPSDSPKSDGRIASVVYIICLTTAGIVLNVTAWLQVDRDVTGISIDHVDGFLITCICPALIWIAYIFCKQNNRKTVDFITPLPHSHRPLMAGAYVFGAGSSVMDILHISYYLQCSTNMSSLAFSFFKAVFILTQILFLRKFANATLHKGQSIRLVLFHILGTNICIWFRALFSHIRLLSKGESEIEIGNLTDTHSWCGQKDVPMSKIWSASEPYLYPFTMEYSLIAGLYLN